MQGIAAQKKERASSVFINVIHGESHHTLCKHKCPAEGLILQTLDHFQFCRAEKTLFGIWDRIVRWLQNNGSIPVQQLFASNLLFPVGLTEVFFRVVSFPEVYLILRVFP